MERNIRDPQPPFGAMMHYSTKLVYEKVEWFRRYCLGHNDMVIQIYTYPTPPDLIMGA